MNILNFSSSTKLSDVSYQALQEKFSLKMEQVILKSNKVVVDKKFIQDFLLLNVGIQFEVQSRADKKRERMESQDSQERRTRSKKLNRDRVDVR